MHFFTNPVLKYLSTCRVPGTVLVTEDTRTNGKMASLTPSCLPGPLPLSALVAWQRSL